MEGGVGQPHASPQHISEYLQRHGVEERFCVHFIKEEIGGWADGSGRPARCGRVAGLQQLTSSLCRGLNTRPALTWPPRSAVVSAADEHAFLALTEADVTEIANDCVRGRAPMGARKRLWLMVRSLQAEMSGDMQSPGTLLARTAACWMLLPLQKCVFRR